MDTIWMLGFCAKHRVPSGKRRFRCGEVGLRARRFRAPPPFADLIFQKCSEPDSFLRFFWWNRALATVSFAFCQPHRPKALHSFWRFLNEIELSLQSRAYFAVRTRPRKSKSAPNMSVFSRFLCKIELSLQSPAHFAELIFQKCTLHGSFLSIFLWNRTLATVLCTFCRQLLQIEARNRRNRDPTSATAEATLPGKTQGFAPGNLFKPEFTRSRSLTLPN